VQSLNREKPVSAKTDLPGVHAAQEVLGLSLDEIARAIEVDKSTLYRRRVRNELPDKKVERLRRLEEFATDVDHALPRDAVAYWLDAPASVFSGKTPRQMIREGRTELVHGALLAITHLIRSLGALDQGASGFPDLLARRELPVATKAALALVDEQIDDLVAAMQTPAAAAAAARGFDAVPRVKVRPAAGGSSSGKHPA
jgi:uncharacterized protein (DUF2384 family)